MTLAAEAAIQTLYTLAGTTDPRYADALKVQVEHRSTHLSRRGFMGLTGAAGVSMVFSPLSQLWTPAQVETGSVIVEAGLTGAIARVSAPLMPLAEWFAGVIDSYWSTPRGYSGATRPPADWGGSRANRSHHPRSRWQTIIGRDVDRVLPTLLSEGPDAVKHFVMNRGSGAARDHGALLFNERIPLPVLAFETDPTVQIADFLAPRCKALCRVTQWVQYGTEPGMSFEIAGVYSHDEPPRNHGRKR